MRLSIEFSTFNGWVLLGLDGLGLRPLVQRHLAMGTRGGVWQIRCEPEGTAARILPHAIEVLDPFHIVKLCVSASWCPHCGQCFPAGSAAGFPHVRHVGSAA